MMLMEDGIGMMPRIGEAESALIPGMAAPRPLAASPAAMMGPQALSITDTSGPGPTPLQSPLWWNYDFDPATKNARATFLGINQPGTLGAISASSLSLTTPLPIASGGTNDSGTAWSTYTPNLSATSGTGIVGTAQGRYKTIGKTCVFQALVQITNLGTAATALRVSLPIASGPASNDCLVNAFDETAGTTLLYAKIPGGAIPIVILTTPSGAFPVAVNCYLIISGSYETS